MAARNLSASYLASCYLGGEHVSILIKSQSVGMSWNNRRRPRPRWDSAAWCGLTGGSTPGDDQHYRGQTARSIEDEDDDEDEYD